MGLEDYRILLKAKPRKSVFPEGGAASRRLTAGDIAGALETTGFVRQPQPLQVGPARLAGVVETETRLTARQELPQTAQENGADGEYIVEALIRGHADSRGGELLFDSLSMRFAVCQPEGAAWHFLKLVKRLCDNLSLAVVHGEKTYSPEVFWAFRLRANEQIRSQQVLWREIFKGDTEQPALAVEETWGHFLKKHPGLRDSGERSASRAAAALKTCVEPSMEETLPGKAARTVPVRRESRP